ncbi:transmembrane protein, putative [Bodo saltans]|uniref:Transmembrane protein, putative n=1 Tax=Bodo saltans TaxID=75058 RepID=A0A0S4J434_BODSA|nr:transmembrane protein, putative [Bodo saltans]|eukprot:CUG73552.1 transmembrane protein, putative [Bodo saltans]
MYAALRCIAFPSSLQPVWVVALPSTVVSVVQIAALSTGCPADVISVAVGLMIALGPLCALIMIALWAPINVIHVPYRRSSKFSCRATLERVFKPSWSWESRDGQESIQPENKLRHCYLLLREYRSLPYAALEASVLVAVGVLTAMSGHGSNSQCASAAALLAVLYAAQLIICILCRPFMTHFSLSYAWLTLTLTMLSAILQFSSFLVSGSSESAQLLLQLSLVASLCDLWVLGASIVKTLIDFAELAVTLHTFMRPVRQPPLMPESSLLNNDESDEHVLEEMQSLLVPESLCDNFCTLDADLDTNRLSGTLTATQFLLLMPRPSTTALQCSMLTNNIRLL